MIFIYLLLTITYESLQLINKIFLVQLKFQVALFLSYYQIFQLAKLDIYQ